MRKDYRKLAKKLKDLGISVVPLRTDGSKLPKIEWKVFQTRRMANFEIDRHFKECGGIAAVTGKISRLYNIDFDLKYQTENQDFWKDFMASVPKEMKKRMLVNSTKNGGKHVWVRTDYEAKSTHLTRRASLLPELMVKYNELISQGKSPEKASEQLLRKPYEVVIETRSRGSYAVIVHPEYKREYGEKIGEFSIEEVEFLNEIAYSLDYCFIPRVKTSGSKQKFSTMRKFDEDSTAQDTLNLLEQSGMFRYVDTERNGNIKVLRLGSNAKYSGRIYAENGAFHVFTTNSIFDTSMKSTFSPFEVYMTVHDLTYEQAVDKLCNN